MASVMVAATRTRNFGSTPTGSRITWDLDREISTSISATPTGNLHGNISIGANGDNGLNALYHSIFGGVWGSSVAGDLTDSATTDNAGHMLMNSNCCKRGNLLS